MLRENGRKGLLFHFFAVAGGYCQQPRPCHVGSAFPKSVGHSIAVTDSNAFAHHDLICNTNAFLYANSVANAFPVFYGLTNAVAIFDRLSYAIAVFDGLPNAGIDVIADTFAVSKCER